MRRENRCISATALVGDAGTGFTFQDPSKAFKLLQLTLVLPKSDLRREYNLLICYLKHQLKGALLCRWKHGMRTQPPADGGHGGNPGGNPLKKVLARIQRTVRRVPHHRRGVAVIFVSYHPRCKPNPVLGIPWPCSDVLPVLVFLLVFPYIPRYLRGEGLCCCSFLTYWVIVRGVVTYPCEPQFSALTNIAD